MAPEVIQNKSYNSSVDMFSFSMILYGLCEDSIPYRYLDTNEIINSITSGQRPKFSQLKNNDLQELISKCWDGESTNRPTAINVVRTLQSINKKEYKSNMCSIA